jgi:hypothetical protein
VFQFFRFFHQPAPFSGLFFLFNAPDQGVGAFGISRDGGGELDQEVEEVGVDLSLSI